MRGYPKHIATKTDFANLLAIPEFRPRALDDLDAIRSAEDETALRTLEILEDGTAVTESVPNPMPLWKVKGFSSRQDVADMIAAYGGEA